MGRHSYHAGDAVIPNGTSVSSVIPAENLSHAEELVIEAPDTLTGANVDVEVKEPDDADWDKLTNEGTLVQVTAGEMNRFPWIGKFDLRIVSDGSETAERTIPVYGIESVSH